MNLRKLGLFMLCIALGCAISAVAEDAPAPASTPAALPEVDHMVYLSFLPEPEELMKDAAANGLTVLRLDKTADTVVVSYKYPDGRTATLGYALLSAAGKADRIAAARRTTEVVREPEVIYVEREPRTRVIYRERHYDDFWPPLILGLGIGYISGHNNHSSHWRGHYRGHRSHRGHGGWHR